MIAFYLRKPIQGTTNINSKKSAVLSILSVTNCIVNRHQFFNRFTRGLYHQECHIKPVNSQVWDPWDVLEVLSKIPGLSNLELINLSKKTLTLLMLATMGWLEEMHKMSADRIIMHPSVVTIYLGEAPKSTDPFQPNQDHLKIIVIAFPPDPSIWLVTLKHYVQRTELLKKT